MNRDEILYEQMSELYDIAMEGFFQKMRDKANERKLLNDTCKKIKKELRESKKVVSEHDRMRHLISKIPSGTVYKSILYRRNDIQKIMPYVKKEIMKIKNDSSFWDAINKIQSQAPASSPKIKLPSEPKADGDPDCVTITILENVDELLESIDRHQPGDPFILSNKLRSTVDEVRRRVVTNLNNCGALSEYHFSVIQDTDDYCYWGDIQIDGIRVTSPSEISGNELDLDEFREVTGIYNKI